MLIQEIIALKKAKAELWYYSPNSSWEPPDQ